MTTHLHRARLGALLLGLAVLTAVAASPVVANADTPPTMDVTPTTVIIPNFQTTGNYTVSWTKGSDPIVNLTYEMGNIGKWDEQKSMDGKQVLPISAGQTDVWTLWNKDHTKVLESVAVHGKHPDADCSQSCIATATATPHGTFAHFSVFTKDVVKKIVIEIYKPNQPNSTRSTELHPLTIDNGADFSNLDANTIYKWHVWAHDSNGKVELQSGLFKTLHRNVEITFQKIDVIDDSDDLSGGDLSFWFNVAGNWNMKDVYGEVNVDTGDSAWPNHVETIKDAPTAVLAGIYGRDDDCGNPFHFCSEAYGPAFDGGSSQESDWASTSQVLNLNVPGPNESFTAVTDFKTTQWALKFRITVKYVVTYTFS